VLAFFDCSECIVLSSELVHCPSRFSCISLPRIRSAFRHRILFLFLSLSFSLSLSLSLSLPLSFALVTRPSFRLRYRLHAVVCRLSLSAGPISKRTEVQRVSE